MSFTNKSIQDFIQDQIESTGSISFDKLKDDIRGKALKEDDIFSILMWADSFQSMQTFLLFKNQIEGSALYWKALREAYQGSDNLYQLKNEILQCFLSEKPNKKELMNEDERKLLASLDDQLTVYRGMTKVEADSKQYGISWTLNKAKAEYFAYTYGRNFETDHLKKTVISININKDQIQALFNGRNEQEIIITPHTTQI